MGYAAQVTIGDVEVLAVKSELHLATDGISAPIVALWQQMVNEARPKLVISTGTAGGIGAATQLGDVFAVTNAKFNCTEEFKDKPWAQQLFTGPGIQGGGHGASFDALVAPNAGRLRPGGHPRSRCSPSAGQRAGWRPSTTSASLTPPTPSASSATTPRRERRRWTTPPCRWPSRQCVGPAAVVLDPRRQRSSGLLGHRRPCSPKALGRWDLPTVRLLGGHRVGHCHLGGHRQPQLKGK